MYKKYLLSLSLLCLIISKTLLGINTGTKEINGDITTKDSITLNYNLDSIVHIPYGVVSKINAANDISVIYPNNTLLFDNVSNGYELINGKVPGLIGNTNIRGLGGALVVIDGIPRELSSVNIQEIEQITILKDVNSSLLYGTRADKGVILIKTKRGKPNEKRISGFFEAGINDPISYPTYLGSADYMELFNEARVNNGLNPLYSEDVIGSTRAGTDRVRFPDMNYYGSEFLKEFKPTSRFISEFSGGNRDAQYYLNLGWYHTGTLMNKGRDESYNKINLRSNIDFKIIDKIRAYVDVVGVFDFDNRVNGNFFSDASTIRPNAYAPLIDSSLVADKALLSSGTFVEGKYLVGGTSIYRNNPYGYLNLGGYNNNYGIVVQFNNGYKIDMSSITEGLSLNLNVSFDFYNRFTASQTNTYAVFQPSWNDDNQMSLTKIGEDFFSGSQEIRNSYLNRKFSFSGLLDYQKVFRNDHALSLSLLAYYDTFNETSGFYTSKHAHLGNRFNYVYKNKYIVDFSSAISYSNKLAPENRLGFSPSVGLAWVISEEDFFNKTFINFLKLRLSGGIMNTDVTITDYYRYEDIFEQQWGYSWYDSGRSNQSTVVSNAGNPNLFYEKRKEYNVGFESLLFNKEVFLEFSAFHELRSDRVTSSNNRYPNYLGGINPLINYAENKFSGIELGVTWRKNFTDFSYELGTSMTIYQTEITKRDEYWPEEYLYRVGNPINANWGLEAIGLFEDESDIQNHAIQEFGEVQPGDIKYKDQNKDGVVNDNDIVMLENASSTFIGGASLLLNYKNFSLYVHSTFRDGSYRMANSAYYWVYGDRKYSEIVKNRWTEQTSKTATYPRLSSEYNSNNFRNSSYWIYDNSLISIDRIQLNYNFPKQLFSKFFIQNMQVYARASNVMAFAKNKDKIQLNVGSEPQYKFYALGLKVNF
ncbi:SusC/RagA family TonB-linked outer membrane protein [Mariniphaga sediminis]|nr:SusC/RagA family TonB-linked outer membrane protein [Mariniphaga sediminis]